LASKVQALEALRQKVAGFETGPVLAMPHAPGSSEPLAIPRGTLSEVFADSIANAGAALGFALGQARSMLGAAHPGLLVLQLKSDVQEMGLPYGLGLRAYGLESSAFVLIRTDTIVELLWAMEEAIACRAVGAVIADIAYPHKALDFTASRRLALRAAGSGAAVFIVRYGREREASAAKFRWKITPQPSRPPPFDDKAPGAPRWRVTLEKGRLGRHRKATPEGEVFLVDWTENGFVLADIDSSTGARAPLAAPLHGAQPAALGDRLSQAS